MAKADYIVNVHWKAQPFTDAYYRQNEITRAVIDSLLTGKVNDLIPPSQQSQWRNLPKAQADYYDILAFVNARLLTEVVPPTGTHLVLPTPYVDYVLWVKVGPSHAILFNAMLSDPDGSNKRPWDFQVTYKGITYDARMGLSYECLLDEP